MPCKRGSYSRCSAGSGFFRWTFCLRTLSTLLLALIFVHSHDRDSSIPLKECTTTLFVSIHSTIDKYLRCFQFGSIPNGVAKSIVKLVSWWTYVHISVGYVPWIWVAASKVVYISHFSGTFFFFLAPDIFMSAYFTSVSLPAGSRSFLEFHTTNHT